MRNVRRHVCPQKLTANTAVATTQELNPNRERDQLAPIIGI